MLLRPRRGEPRRARRRTASPVSASRVHGLLFPFLLETACRTSAWLDDGFMPPRSPKSLAASRGVQWSRRAAAGFSAHCRPARTIPCASGRPDRTAWVFCVRAARTLPSSRTGPPLSSRHTHHPAQRSDPLARPRNRRTLLPFGPFLDEGCERPERLGGRGLLLDDGRKSPYRLGGCREEFREGQTVTATLAWGCGFEPTFCRAPGAFFFAP